MRSLMPVSSLGLELQQGPASTTFKWRLTSEHCHTNKSPENQRNLSQVFGTDTD